MSVAEQLQAVKQHLLPGVTLVAVSKTKPNAAIMEAYEAGQRDFGENYVQELVQKAEQLPKDIHWHFIGHLQSNKVKYIAPFVWLIQGVDSEKLLTEINKQAQKNNRIINCLLQIYIAQEESKFGFSAEECLEFVASPRFKQLNNVAIAGVMGMASNTDDQEQIKREFSGLKTCHEKLQQIVPEARIMSAGMSADAHIAMTCGSNLVRIGSTIFGNRVYP